MRRLLAAIPVLLLAVACGGPDREGPPAPAPKAPAATPRAGRQLSDGERAAMLSALGGEQSGTRRVWFAVTPGDAEAVALKNAFEAVFKQAGWETETQPVTGMALKPGLSILIAAEEPPAYVGAAQQALQATSFEFKAGLGYGAYYAERKQADPKWPGIPMAAGQDFVVVIGPQPPA
jgi:hypothetical protein